MCLAAVAVHARLLPPSENVASVSSPTPCAPETRRSRNERGVLPARTILQPIQTEHLVAGVSQPGRDFFRLKRPIPWAKVAIEQLCDFFSRARSLDLVQRSEDMLPKTVIRIWRLGHLRFSGLEGGPGANCSFCVWSGCKQKQRVTRNRLVPTGESICESPRDCALRQHRPKYTSAQSRLVPRLASPNSRCRVTRRSIPSTLRVSHRARARCSQQFPRRAEHHRDSAVQSSLTSHSNFTEKLVAHLLVQTGQSRARRSIGVIVDSFIHNPC
jgi:hypothetical protein